MADHFTQQVVTALVAKLGSLPTTGSNVFADDDWKRGEADLPCIVVEHRGYTSEPREVGFPPRTSHVVTVLIHCIATDSPGAGARATSRQIAKEVEHAWLATLGDMKLGLALRNAQIVSAEETPDTDNTNAAYCDLALQCQVQLNTRAGSPDVIV